jgi:hypothetical protein
MANKLIKPDSNFTMVANSIMRKKGQSLKTIGLYAYLLSLPDGWRFSISGLASVLADGKDAIRAAVRELEELGYLRRVQSRDGKGGFDNADWQLFYEPVKIEENTVDEDAPVGNPPVDTPTSPSLLAESPSSENPTTGNPTSDFPTQNNKYKYKNVLTSKKESINSAHAREGYQDILDRHGCGDELQKRVWQYIQFAQLNGRMLTNDMLEETLTKLEQAAQECVKKDTALRQKYSTQGDSYVIQLLLTRWFEKALELRSFTPRRPGEYRDSRDFGSTKKTGKIDNHEYTDEFLDSLLNRVSLNDI